MRLAARFDSWVAYGAVAKSGDGACLISRRFPGSNPGRPTRLLTGLATARHGRAPVAQGESRRLLIVKMRVQVPLGVHTNRHLAEAVSAA